MSRDIIQTVIYLYSPFSLQSPDSRTHPTLPAANALALLPFKAYSATLPPAGAKPSTSPSFSPERASVLGPFTLLILSIPLLPQRIPLASLTALAAMPLEDIVVSASAPDFISNSLSTLGVEASAYLLANVIAFASKRIGSFSTSKVLAGYLRVVQVLLDQLPISTFAGKRKDVVEDVKGKGKAVEVIVLDDSDDEDDQDDAEVIQRARAKVGTGVAQADEDGDTPMATSTTVPTTATSSPTFAPDSRTLGFLSSLASREHLLAILALSTRYASTTRPALASFLVSLLTTMPGRRDEVINAVMYGPGAGAGERGGGLLRELFRGYVRAGALGKVLGGSTGGDRGVLSALKDPKLGLDWTTLILLSELYARCLLTLGDDEFYSPRNPLSLDEVVGLSGLLRNLAFALYWQEGNLTVGESELTVQGTRLGVEKLRTLATGLLQQIHAREYVNGRSPHLVCLS